MWLWIAATIAVLGGVISPFTSRLHATGLWAGKAVAPPSTQAALPTGLQDALTHGWPSRIVFVGTMLPFVAGLVGLLDGWLTALSAFVLALVVSAIAHRAGPFTAELDYYLRLLRNHARRRSNRYRNRGAVDHSAAAAALAEDVEELILLYEGSGVTAPSVRVAAAAPFGAKSMFLSTEPRATADHSHQARNAWKEVYADDDVRIELDTSWVGRKDGFNQVRCRWTWTASRVLKMTPGVSYLSRLEVLDLDCSGGRIRTDSVTLFDEAGAEIVFDRVVPSPGWDLIEPGTLADFIHRPACRQIALYRSGS